MRILVVFGSSSDNNVYDPLVQKLENNNHQVDSKVISAHRNLEQLQVEIGKSSHDLIIAGAGLAAALPGVVAAMTDIPVIGLPVAAHFGGLDSLCSIAQMPYGVPVIASGADKVDEIVKFVEFYGTKEVNLNALPIVIDTEIANKDYAKKELERTQVLADLKGIKLNIVSEIQPNQLNIVMVRNIEDVKTEEYCLYVPLFGSDEVKDPMNYLKVFEWTNKGGMWLCANNTRNALLSVLKLTDKKEMAA